MWEQQVICGKGRPSLCQSFLSFLPVLSIHRPCFFDGAGHMQGNLLTKNTQHMHTSRSCVLLPQGKAGHCTESYLNGRTHAHRVYRGIQRVTACLYL